MNLSQDFLDLLRTFLAGGRTLEEVHAWLVQNAQAVVDAGDPTLTAATGRTWIAWCEYDAEHLDLEGVREMLAELAPASEVTSALERRVSEGLKAV